MTKAAFAACLAALLVVSTSGARPLEPEESALTQQGARQGYRASRFATLITPAPLRDYQELM